MLSLKVFVTNFGGLGNYNSSGCTGARLGSYNLHEIKDLSTDAHDADLLVMTFFGSYTSFRLPSRIGLRGGLPEA
jgi:hypothetical protein